MSKKLLEGKNAIVTGTARGIGHKIVEVFAANGANVWACARKQTPEMDAYCKDLSEKYGVEVKPVYFELTDRNAMKDAFKSIMAEKKPIDVLVNNAGITYNALFQMSNEDKIKETFDINFTSHYLFSQYVIKLMLRAGQGSVVNISSTAAIDGNSGRSIYGATKASVWCASKSMAEELGPKGIRVNCIAPGLIDTPMNAVLTEKEKELLYTTNAKYGGLLLCSDDMNNWDEKKIETYNKIREMFGA